MLMKKRNAIKKLSMVLGISAVLSGFAMPISTFAAGNEYSRYAEANVVEDASEADPDALQMDAIASGTTKGGCAWSLGTDHTLVINGTGNAVLKNDTPWADYSDKIQAISINVPKAKNPCGLFMGCYNVKWVKAKIGLLEGDMGMMFSCRKYVDKKDQTALESADLDINTSGCTDMSGLFMECTKLKSLKLTNFNTSNVKDMSYMFMGCEKLTRIDLSSFNTANVKNFAGMFAFCTALKDPVIGTFNTANAENMRSMFDSCKALTTLNVGHFNTQKVKNFSWMFDGCQKLTNLNGITNFRTNACEDAQYMFFGTALKSLDLSNFDLSKCKKVDGLVGNCANLEYIKCPKNLVGDVSLNTTGESYKRKWYRDDNHALVKSLPMHVNKSVPIHLQEKDNKFVDVRTSGWQHQFVEYAYNNKLMNGVGNTADNANLVIFNGDGLITRAQFVQTLYNKEKTPSVKYEKAFNDVPKGKWFTNAVIWAYKKEITGGTAKKTFGVDNNIRRQDLVTMLYKYAKMKNKKYITVDKNYSLSKNFADYKKVESYAKDAMTWAASKGIITGKTIAGSKKTNLDPLGNTTRAECAAILKKYEDFRKTVK